MPDAAFPAPFDLFRSAVRPEWIDSNGHMNLAYYVLLFDQAVDLLFDAVGFDAEYREAAQCGPFAVETHTIYERELLDGERVGVRSRILAADTKRLHVAQEMVSLADDARAAVQEAMYLHVDLAGRRAAPFRADLKQRLEVAAQANAALPPLDWTGRRVAMRGHS